MEAAAPPSSPEEPAPRAARAVVISAPTLSNRLAWLDLANSWQVGVRLVLQAVPDCGNHSPRQGSRLCIASWDL